MMTSINAGGAFYRVQNSLNQNSENVSKSMQRLASGQQNISPGDATGSKAVAFGTKAEAASLKVGLKNGTEALQAVEMLNNDVSQLNDIVVRLEELATLGTNGFMTTQDRSAIDAEADALLAEMTRIATDAKWKGNTLTNGAGVTVGFGRNNGSIAIELTAFALPTIVDTAATPATDAITGEDIARASTTGPTEAVVTAGLKALKTTVDAMAVEAGALFNTVTNTMNHMSTLTAGYELDVASKMDVDFAGETTELAKGQILAQAGTAMLAQANAQGQGMLALIQS
jgi:flagellin